MGKKVLVVSSSPRKNGNSETLADAFANGAREAGHSVETVLLREKQLGFGRGCLACLKLGALRHPRRCRGNCRQDARRRCSGVATPVYYSVCGQLKTMLDRANPLFGSDYAFTEVYLLAAAAEGGRSTFEGTEKAVRGWVDCFPRRALAGTVFAGGVSGVGEIAGHPALEQARRMGMEI